jgi:hypothetical protein
LKKGGILDIQTANKAKPVTGACDGFIHVKPLTMCKRIGSTLYEVEVYIMNSAGETADAKIMRLIKNDLNPRTSHGKMDLPQTDRLPERGSI